MAAVGFRHSLQERDTIGGSPARPKTCPIVAWHKPKPLWRLCPGARGGNRKQCPLSLCLVVTAHAALLGLLLTGTVASWMLAVPDPGDGSQGASQGALIVSSVAVSHPAPVPQPDMPTPVTLSPLRTPPPPLLQVSAIHIQTAPARPPEPPSAAAAAPDDRAIAPPESGNQGIAGNQSDRRNVDNGRTGNHGGGQTQPASYEAEVLAWINRHKHDPHQSIQARQEGIVGIAVELDRWGRLLRVELLNSSGHRSLDQAALRQVRAAAPYPRPIAADWNRKRIELNLAFNLRNLGAAS